MQVIDHAIMIGGHRTMTTQLPNLPTRHYL